MLAEEQNLQRSVSTWWYFMVCKFGSCIFGRLLVIRLFSTEIFMLCSEFESSLKSNCLKLHRSPNLQPPNIAMKSVFPFLYSCLGFQNLKNVPPSGLNFSCQYVWCISIEQFVATFLKLWIGALFIGYSVWMRFTRDSQEIFSKKHQWFWGWETCFYHCKNPSMVKANNYH